MNDQCDVIENGSIVIDGNRIVLCRAARMDAGGAFRQDHRGRSNDRDARHGQRPLPLPGESRPRHDAEQAVGNLARLLSSVFARYARRRISTPARCWAAWRCSRTARPRCSIILPAIKACRFMGAGAAIQAMRDLGLRHVAALTMTDKNYEDTIPLGNTDAQSHRRDQAHERERSEIDPGLAR